MAFSENINFYDSIDINKRVRILRNIVYDAGQIIKQAQSNLTDNQIMKKSEKDLVTSIDISTETYIKNRIVKEIYNDDFSGIFIGEELTPEEKSEYGDLWFIDPIDGTTNFIHGHPAYCISIANYLGNYMHPEKSFGIVYAPEFDFMYLFDGNISTLNDKKIWVSRRDNIKDTVAATGFACVRGAWKKDNVDNFSRVLRNTNGIRRCGSAALDLCFVASGKVDFFWEFNLNPWDVAAGALIVKGAGGSVCGIGSTQDYIYGKSIMASNGLIDESIKKIIEDIKIY